MANQNKPMGLTPRKYLNGADWDSRGNLYYIDYTDTNAYYPGDLVTLHAGLDGVSGLQTITLSVASSTEAALGVIMAIGASPSETTSNRGGPYIDPTNLTLTYAPATKTKNYFALVCDDPNVIYEIQEGGGATTLTKTATSKNAYFLYAAPATGVYLSGTTLDNGTTSGNTVGTSNAFTLKIMGLQQIIDPYAGTYNTFGLYAKWLVMINNHNYRAGTTGI